MKNTLIQIIFISVVLSQNTFASIQQNCKHLLLRTSFSLEKKELNNCVKTKKYSTYVKQILNEKQLPLKENHFDTLKVLPKKIGKKFHINEKKAYRKNRKQENKLLQKWWLEKMITTKDPLREKMTLFWHNHFTSSYKKVKQAKLMYNQNQLFRKHALGNFRSLLHDIIKDPAMIIYLDNKYNKKSHPNENLSRELLELFTMGEGNYNEYDVKELARGLSGYSIDKNFEFKFKKRFHDSSGKTFFNTSGYLDADDMIDIILQQKQTSVYIVTKLYKEFVSYTSDKDEILRLAKIFKEDNYELKPLLYEMLTSKHFLSKNNASDMIKSPIELVVGTLRSLNYTEFNKQQALFYTKKMNQELFAPPNVKGWTQGKAWIDSSTFLHRKDFLQKLIRSDKIDYALLDYDTLSDDFLAMTTVIRPHKSKIKYLNKILQSPVYQLK